MTYKPVYNLYSPAYCDLAGILTFKMAAKIVKKATNGFMLPEYVIYMKQYNFFSIGVKSKFKWPENKHRMNVM